MAQRVMDCGDAGHILLSKRVAEDLAQYRHWQPYLHDVGDCQVKHDVTVSVVNLYTDEAGNSALPVKFVAAQTEKITPASARAATPDRPKSWFVGLAALGAVLLGGAIWFFAHQNELKTISPGTNTPPLANTGNTGAATPASPIDNKSVAVLPF